VQGKTELVKPTELVALLQECCTERLAQYERHKAVAAHIGPYDANNTYQYVINREELHLSWLADALKALGAPLPPAPPGPSLTLDRGQDAWRSLVAEDAQRGCHFLEKWRPRVEAMTHARNQTMLRLMLGEVAEQVRFFEQAAAGTDDLLGRSTVGAGKRGSVGSSRWLCD
jgi:hypothetical protein